MSEIYVDFKKITGRIKPVHGFNNCARRTGYGDILPAFKELCPPFVRLHDTGGMYGGSHYVDIPNVFPDKNADEELEASYDFTLTDYYLKALYDAGTEIFYRFGVTIEHAPKKYNIFAPGNPQKWARICEHIVRHYNCGWANGYHFNVKYWEIWNEPDSLDPKVEPYGPPNFIGTEEDYYRLYSVTANHIRECHPDVKIGGYASCYILGSNVNGIWTKGPTYFFTGFLDYITAPETKAPLDFFSWHGYLGKGSMKKIEEESTFIRQTLKDYGFDITEIIDDEWNCNICDIETDDARTQYYINMRNEKGASHAAAAMYEMQRCKVDMAMYYDAQLWCEYGALFNVPSLEPSLTYYAFKQFSELYKLGNECECVCPDGLFACAAAGDYNMLAVSNISESPIRLRIRAKNACGREAQLFITDSTHRYERIKTVQLDDNGGAEVTLSGYSFISVKIFD